MAEGGGVTEQPIDSPTGGRIPCPKGIHIGSYKKSAASGLVVMFNAYEEIAFEPEDLFVSLLFAKMCLRLLGTHKGLRYRTILTNFWQFTLEVYSPPSPAGSTTS